MEKPPNRMVFDLELARPLPDKLGKPNWDAAPKCGISVLGGWPVNAVAPYVWLLDSTRLPRVILTDDHAVKCFDACDGVVSWNGAGFDNRVMAKAAPNVFEVYNPKKHVDLMAIAASLQAGVDPGKLASGIPADWITRIPGGPGAAHKGWGLDAVGKATLGFGKLEGFDGAGAPLQWQQGRYSEVTSYCLVDVGVTRALYIHAWEHGWLQSPERGRVAIPRALL